MKVLVTGASGFVGGPTVRAMSSRAIVRGVVRNGSVPGAQETVRISDLGSDVDWAPITDGVDAVIHLAARVHVMNDGANAPLSAFRRVNVEGTRRLAEAAAAAGIGRFAFVSSVKVHGESTDAEPFRPDGPLRPLDPYGQSKAEAEEVLREIERRTGMEVVIIRPPLVYGPGVKANFLNLLRAVDRGVPLPFGMIRNRRSLVYVENLADLLVSAATDARAGGRTFLVSDGAPVSTADLVRSMAEALGRPARLLPVPPAMMRLGGRLLGKGPAVDRLLGSLEVDDSATREILDWAPASSFEEGLAATASWHREERAK